MHRIILSVFLVLLLNTTVISFSNEGPCPIIPTPENFNTSKFIQGKWYHLFHDFGDELHFFKDLKCIEKELSYDNIVGSLVVETYAISELTNRPIWIKYYGFATNTPGAFKLLLKDVPLPFDSAEFRVVDTDYLSYGVAYVCAFNQTSNTHYVSVGICSRSLQLTAENKLENTIKLFKMYGLNFDFIPTDWSDCRARCESH